MREQAADWGRGEKLPRYTSENPLTEPAVSISARDKQVGAFVLRRPAAACTAIRLCSMREGLQEKLSTKYGCARAIP